MNISKNKNYTHYYVTIKNLHSRIKFNENHRYIDHFKTAANCELAVGN